jgi:uncharacterized membrane protein YhaH (DUF805 family)
MDYSTLLFSFTGRINRAKYWLGVGLLLAYWIVVGIVLSILFYGLGGPGYILAIAAGAAAAIGAFWAGLGIGIKRLHDRAKSGWWLLLFWVLPGILTGVGTAAGSESLGLLLSLASFAVSIWGFVEIGCLRGTEGPNQYGPDPLPPQD